MADHKVTINSGYVLVPPTIPMLGAPPIQHKTVVTFENLEGDACMLTFALPSPFGTPTIVIPNKKKAKPMVTVNPTIETSYHYTCGPAPAATPEVPTDLGNGIIIVDPTGPVPEGDRSKAKRKNTSKSKGGSKAASKAKGKGAAKAKGNSKSKAKAKSNAGGKAKRR
jgi:hypothetical protein